MSIKLLDKIQNAIGKIYILGNGELGTILCQYLEKLDVEIESFVVNDEYYHSQMSRTIAVSQLPDLDEELLIVVAVRYNQDIVAKKVMERGYKVAFINYPEDMLDIYGEVYRRLFKKNDINMKEPILKNGKYVFLNPFYLQGGRALDWYMEARDNILPVLFDDDTLIDEGPYFYDCVYIEKDDIVIDAGANIGLFSAIAAVQGKTVYAFEPDKENVGYLKKIADILPNINIIEKALADKEGENVFFLDKEYRSRNSLYASMMENDTETITVPMITIDTIVEREAIEHVDFIKADIEGAERYMLSGAEKTIKRFHPKISICTYHLKDDPEVLETLLKEIEPRYQIIHRWKKMFAYYKA